MPNQRKLKKQKRPPPSESEKAARSIRAVLVKAALGAARVDFQTTGNPIHLLNGLVTARRARVLVPAWIIKRIAAASEQVLKQKGKITLDAALGFKPAKGHRGRWTELEQQEKDNRLKWLIEKRPMAIAELKAELRQDLGLRLTKSVSGYGGAAEQALAILHEEGDTTYKDVDSLIQHYNKKIKHRPARAPR